MSGEMAPSRSRLARLAVVSATATAAAALAGGSGAGAAERAALEACAALDVPAKPSQRVWCTTPSATLVIAHQSDPVLLDGTEVRVLSGRLLGASIRVRLRVRNQTPAEQDLSAGGQELYLYLDGSRVDLAVFRDVHFGVGEAKTLQLDYVLSPEQLAALGRSEGRLDFGVRPWHDGALPAPLVGVVRVRVGG
jgi:hypothetical protein